MTLIGHWEWHTDHEPDDTRKLRIIFGQIPSAVAALGTVVDGHATGMTVSTFAPVSLEPPLVSVCIARTSASWQLLRQGERIGVSVLAGDQGQLARQLAGPPDGRLAGATASRTGLGALLLEPGVAWFECSIDREITAGDHIVVLLRIHRHGLDIEREPLIFHRSGFRQMTADQLTYANSEGNLPA
jgi:flavin reductase (DIM6/NTAB) family NADH-FMN oxidoreductase RutF